MGLNNLLYTHHTDIIITHHSSCPQRRVLFIVTIDTNITTVSTDKLTQAVHSRIKVLLPIDLHNENVVDVLRSFRLALLVARQNFLDQLGS